MDYIIHIAVLFCIYGSLALSLGLLVGRLGIFSLAHAGFFGIGAYTAAILCRDAGWSYLVATAAAMGLAVVVGVVVGLPSLRIRDDMFAIVSFAFQVVIYTIMNNWGALTGGALGLTGIPSPHISGWTVDTPVEFMFLSLAILLFVYIAIRGMVVSPLGRLMTAVKEDEILVVVSGRNPGQVKLIAFMVTSAMAALAGAVYAPYVSFIDPSSFQVMDSVMLVCMVIIGGADRMVGPLAGAAILIILPELLRSVGLPGPVVGHVRRLLYGGILLVILIYRPEGLLVRGKRHDLQQPWVEMP